MATGFARVALLAAAAWSSLLPVTALATESTHYSIEAELHPSTHTVHGLMHVRWCNTADVEVGEIRLHLYLNAFKPGSTLLMEATLSGRRHPSSEEQGWVHIDGISASGQDLLGELSFVHPDGGPETDQTVAAIKLPQPIPPGHILNLEIEFTSKLPKVWLRTGYAEQFHMVAQWYPKLGVFENGWWNCHEFHYASEFYSDFADYNVRIKLPRHWVAVGTGLCRFDGEEFVCQANKVHDFAWAAGPEEAMQLRSFRFDPVIDVPRDWLENAALLLARPEPDLELAPVEINVLFPAEGDWCIDRIVKAVKTAMAWYGLHCGPYPYPTLSVVVPPQGAWAAGGMEYPTLITVVSHPLCRVPIFSKAPIEPVAVHEFGHQYFYGLLASNEFEEAWLDEGLNTYAEARCLAEAAEIGCLPAHLGSDAATWLSLATDIAGEPYPLPVNLPPWRYRTRSEAFDAVYSRAAIGLRSLELILGTQTFDRALRAYCERWRFKHPTGRDLREVFEEVAGEDLGWFFEGYVAEGKDPDWALFRVIPCPDAGEEGCRIAEVVRQGDLIGPLDIMAEWSGGVRNLVRNMWIMGRWARIELRGSGELKEVRLDPENKWWCEVDKRDNIWPRKTELAPTGWMMQLWQVVEMLIDTWI